MHSNKRFMEELGEVPLLHAYPFGEYSPKCATSWARRDLSLLSDNIPG